MLRVIQVNLHNMGEALDLAVQKAQETRRDLLVLAEYGSARASGGMFVDLSGKAAIMCVNASIGADRVGEGRGFVWIQTQGVYVYSVYFPPNESDFELEGKLNDIADSIKRIGATKVIIAGDINAASPAWGARSSNNRGEIIMEWLETLNLVVVNTGSKPTFEQGTRQSIVDVTLCSQ
ncbi:hypothetical protein PPYR_15704, partial [Photinus pyralis]